MDNLYKSVLSLEKCKYLLTLLADKPNSDSSGFAYLDPQIIF